MINMEIMRNIIRSEEKDLYIILSHADLDGIASSFLIGDFLEKRTNVNMINAICMDPTQKATDEMLEQIYSSIENKEESNIRVIIADRDIASKEVLEKSNIKEVFWLDHHISSINKYNINKEDYKGIKIYEFLTNETHYSAASMVSYFLSQTFKHNFFSGKLNINVNNYQEMLEFIMNSNYSLSHLVALWDTFTWKQKELPQGYNEEDRKNCLILAKASYIIPAKFLYDLMSSNNLEELLPKLKFASDIFDYKFNDMYEKTKETRVRTWFGTETKKIKVLAVADLKSEYISLYADKVFEEEDIDVVVVVNNNGLISCRASQKTDFDVSKLMQKFGNIIGFSGGGHKKAAGCRYKEFESQSVSAKELKELLIDLCRVEISNNGENNE